MTNVIPVQKYDTKSHAYIQMFKQAKALEGTFLNTLTKEMFSSIKTDDKDFGGGSAEETWRGMQAEQMADAMAQSGGIGLAAQLMPTLMQLQEAGKTN